MILINHENSYSIVETFFLVKNKMKILWDRRRYSYHNETCELRLIQLELLSIENRDGFNENCLIGVIKWCMNFIFKFLKTGLRMKDALDYLGLGIDAYKYRSWGICNRTDPINEILWYRPRWKKKDMIA